MQIVAKSRDGSQTKYLSISLKNELSSLVETSVRQQRTILLEYLETTYREDIALAFLKDSL